LELIGGETAIFIYKAVYAGLISGLV